MTQAAAPTFSAPVFSLQVIQVAAPCSADWDSMSGDARARFCGQCSKHVYNLSEMTETAALALVRQKEGNLCVRFYRRADGTVLTQDCPVGVRAALRAAWVKSAARVAALGVFALGLFGFGCKSSGSSAFSRVGSAIGLEAPAPIECYPVQGAMAPMNFDRTPAPVSEPAPAPAITTPATQAE